MKQNRINLAVIIAGIINLIISVIYILQLPEIVPTHFDINWVCDGMGSRWTAILTASLPLLAGICTPIAKTYTKECNKKPVQISMLSLVVYLIVMNWAMLPTMASGLQIGDKLENSLFAWIIFGSLGVLFVSMGNYLPIIQPNKYLGFRIKWTLENKECWRVTHRFAGKFMVILGFIYLACLAVAMMTNATELCGFVLLFTLLVVFIPITSIYAYQHRNDIAS